MSARPQVDPEISISVRGLKKSFDSLEVLRGVDLDIVRGKINVVIGASGGGKSLLVKHMIGLVKPDSGSIHVDGEDIVPMNDIALNQVRRKFGMVFQHAALFDSMTVEENVLFPLKEHKKRELSLAEMKEIARAKLLSLGLRDIEQRYPSELSGGMRKRVGLARAIVMKPEILFFDEPTTGLDPVATDNVDRMISHIASVLGVTAVVISHDLLSTFRIGHRVSMLHQGRIVASGTPNEIRKREVGALRAFLDKAGVTRSGGALSSLSDDSIMNS